MGASRRPNLDLFAWLAIATRVMRWPPKPVGSFADEDRID
jgi:hypothetical protein